jgi:hypothetical protein
MQNQLFPNPAKKVQISKNKTPKQIPKQGPIWSCLMNEAVHEIRVQLESLIWIQQLRWGWINQMKFSHTTRWTWPKFKMPSPIYPPTLFWQQLQFLTLMFLLLIKSLLLKALFLRRSKMQLIGSQRKNKTNSEGPNRNCQTKSLITSSLWYCFTAIFLVTIIFLRYFQVTFSYLWIRDRKWANGIFIKLFAEPESLTMHILSSSHLSRRR